jgi:hypothetical protein
MQDISRVFVVVPQLADRASEGFKDAPSVVTIIKRL